MKWTKTADRIKTGTVKQVRSLIKYMLIFYSLLLLWMPSAFSDLTADDFEKIRTIVKEEVKKEIEVLDARVQTVEKDVSWVRGKLDGIEKQISHATNVTYGLIALIVVAIGIPTAIIAWRSGQDSKQEQKIETQNEKIEALERKIEKLEEDRGVSDYTT